MNIETLIAVARGEVPADLIFTNGRVINTFTGEIEEGNVAVWGGKVAGIGAYTDGREIVDLEGRYLAPGFLDGHFHLESSYLEAREYVRAVVPHGTLGGVTDLHEIANVCGLEGIRHVLGRAQSLPFDLFVTAPSCVPSTGMETSGAALGPNEIRRLLRNKNVIGLGEFMDFPGVIRGADSSLAKLRAVGDNVKEGHAPGLRGRDLNAYLAPLIGSDHETTDRLEGLEKLRRGMYVMIREGSTEKNLEELLPLITDATYHRCMLVVDDRNARDIYRDGDVDAVVRKAIKLGLDPVRAIQLATIVPATFFRLAGLGGIAPGYRANMLVLDDLPGLAISEVYHRGSLVAKDGVPLFSSRRPRQTPLGNTFNVRPFTIADLALRHPGCLFPVMEIVPGQIITRWTTEAVQRENGVIHPDPKRDLLKLVVVERHKATGNIGKGLVKGFGLTSGSLATSVAHDSHNIVAVGTNDQDIYTAVREIENNQGGLVVAEGGRVVASLPLPVAGLLSQLPVESVAAGLEELDRAAEDLGCLVPSPFSVLSFLALPVIPELKLTDLGLVDVMKGELLPVS